MLLQVREVKDRLNSRQRWAVVAVDVLLLTELTWCIYVSNQDLATMTPTFLKMFVPMLAATYVLARVLIRKLRTPEDPSAPSAADQVPAVQS